MNALTAKETYYVRIVPIHGLIALVGCAPGDLRKESSIWETRLTGYTVTLWQEREGCHSPYMNADVASQSEAKRKAAVYQKAADAMNPCA